MARTRITDHRLDLGDERLQQFWAERHLLTLTTLRRDGSLHVVPVGATLDVPAGLVRVIASRTSAKVRHVARGQREAVERGEAGRAGAAVALCQVDGRRWSTVEGRAQVWSEQTDVAEAEERYEVRYRRPRPNPERVVIAVHIVRVLGNLG